MVAKINKEYNEDFYSWIIHNVELIRSGKLTEIDAENVAEELESIGKSEKRELISRLAILISHLLKWKFQTVKRIKSWNYAIKEQRIKLIDLLKDSPSLKHELSIKMEHAYEKAVLIAIRETGMDEEDFPKFCPFNLEECLNREFFPIERAS